MFLNVVGPYFRVFFGQSSIAETFDLYTFRVRLRICIIIRDKSGLLEKQFFLTLIRVYFTAKSAKRA